MDKAVELVMTRLQAIERKFLTLAANEWHNGEGAPEWAKAFIIERGELLDAEDELAYLAHLNEKTEAATHSASGSVVGPRVAA